MTLSARHEELRFPLALLRTPRVGPRGFKALVEHFGSPEQIFAASGEALARLGLGRETLAWLQKPDWGKVEGDLRWPAGDIGRDPATAGCGRGSQRSNSWTRSGYG